MKTNICLFATVLLALSTVAQSVGPALFAPVNGKQKQMELQSVDVGVDIFGFVSETTITMVFRNPTKQQLAGTLYFPLPDGATVSGYALNIDSALVEGVVVEKDRGRVVFEKIVRQGIDPGLVEWTKGNNFKTRVFPLPPGGTRTVQVSYTHDIIAEKGTGQYRLPMAFGKDIKNFELTVNVLLAEEQPQVKTDLGLKFNPWKSGYRATITKSNVDLEGDMVVNLPDLDRQSVLAAKADDGYTYFVIDDRPKASRKKPAGAAAKKIHIVWDASGSMAKRNFEAERDFLKALLSSGSKALAQELDVTLSIVRNELDSSVDLRLRLDNPTTVERLLTQLKNVRYDGASQLAAFTARQEEKNRPDLYLLFSDGLQNFGEQRPSFNAPVHVVNANAAGNPAFLRELAMRSGGNYIDLKRSTPADAADRFGGSQYSFKRAKISAKDAESYPSIPTPAADRFRLAGRFKGDAAAVDLHYGWSGQEQVDSRTLAVRSKVPVKTDLLRRFWAQKKLNDLLVNQEQNEMEITALGTAYGLVTPYTSLIVLESPEQYVEHGIRPPASMPDWQKVYHKQIAQREKQAAEQKKKDLEHIIALWQKRVAWAERTFDYPKDFKYRTKKEKVDAVNSVRASGGFLAGGEQAGEAERNAPGAVAEDLADLSSTVNAERGEAQPLAAASPRRAMNVAAKMKERGNGDSSVEPAIAIKKWDPKTPYLAALKKAKPADRIDLYYKQKSNYGSSPAFYLDCADFFRETGATPLAIQVLSNIAEMEIENPALLRILGHRLAQLKRFDDSIHIFEEVKKMRPEEPQSFRDLALVLAQRADRSVDMVSKRKKLTDVASRQAESQILADYSRSLELLSSVVSRRWDRFSEIELIALVELNNIYAKAQQWGYGKFPMDERLKKLLTMDVRILMTWDADSTDIDLWVTEPSEEKVLYSHNRSTIGGRVSRDFTNGYGPEEYTLGKAMTGMYKVQANYYGSRSVELAGGVTVQLDIFTNYGRPNQKHKAVTVRLKDAKEVVDIADLEF